MKRLSLASIVDGPTSGEVKATTVDDETMIKEGRDLNRIIWQYLKNKKYDDARLGFMSRAFELKRQGEIM